MTTPGRAVLREYAPPPASITAANVNSLADAGGDVQLSPSLGAELLDLDAWAEILTAYGRTMRLAGALTDADGHVLGKCQNAQPVWTLVRDAGRNWTGCPFCISPAVPCTAVADAFRTGGAVMVRDQAGLTHAAVPLRLGKHRLGAIIAGQVFDRYPDPLPLRRVAMDFRISTQQLWDLARRQRPVSSATIQASADLLRVLGHAFLEQRYGAMLKASLAATNGQFRLLVDAVRDHALFTVDATGRVTGWNAGAERMFGYSEAEIMGQNYSCIFAPEDIHNHVPENNLSTASQAGQLEDEGWRIRENGEQFWADVNITTLSDNAGPVRRLRNGRDFFPYRLYRCERILGHGRAHQERVTEFRQCFDTSAGNFVNNAQRGTRSVQRRTDPRRYGKNRTIDRRVSTSISRIRRNPNEREKNLIIDDDRHLLLGLTARLKASGYEVICAVDGTSGIAFAQREAPDLVILDLGLPGDDGFQILKRMRALADLAATPVIVLSARGAADNNQRALEEGAVAFFQKPADNYQFLTAIRQTSGERVSLSTLVKA